MKQLCSRLRLGDIIGTPTTVPGGLMHRMYAVRTTSGHYAIKALNPEIMRRPAAMHNYIASERIAELAARHVPALPAKTIEGEAVQEAGGRFYLVFDWIAGRSLKPDEIASAHSRKIGAILADLHRTDFSSLGMVPDASDDGQAVDWRGYLRKGQERQARWADSLLESIDHLYEWDAGAIRSARLLASETVVTHGDLDPKNVMWHQDSPILIDWESAGYRNPRQDVVETALYWSEDEAGNVDKGKLSAFIDGYREHGGSLHGDWSAVLANGFAGKIGWLAYNLKRSLGMEGSDADERRLGTEQAASTLTAIRRYAAMIADLEAWLIEKSASGA